MHEVKEGLKIIKEQIEKVDLKLVKARFYAKKHEVYKFYKPTKTKK